MVKRFFNKGGSVDANYISSLSDNQKYPQFCLDASNNYQLFNSFRKNPIYNEVLEHVSQEQGMNYLQFIEKDIDVYERIELIKENDIYGSPVTYEYPEVGYASPTTLRYGKVLVDLKNHFTNIDNFKICEIGVGYGGQCRVINCFYKPKSYYLVDIQPTLALTQRYLYNYILYSTLYYKSMNEVEDNNYDLVISNYAFSELRRSIQEVYIHKIIKHSKRGYITYNDIAPDDFKSFKAEELIKLIPGAKILPEEPLTHDNNCIIVWGSNMVVLRRFMWISA